MIKVGINGFGRIGRCVLKIINNMDNVEVVAINDLTDPEQLAYLYKYDSVYRNTFDEVLYDEENLIINDKKIKVYKEENPSNIPWKNHEIDVVLECTGVFTSVEKCMAHISAGAKKVIISAPSKDEAKTVVFGVNENILTNEDRIISCASCTTNCLAPVLNLLHKNYKVIKGYMTTVHAMTNDQETLDIPHKKGIFSRRGRAASLNIIPTSTGAASSIGKVIPSLNGKLEGISLRVPVGDGSLIDLTIEVEKETSIEEINNMFESNVSQVLNITEEPIVSSDVIGNSSGALIDTLSTKVIDKHLVKIIAWYDNELGYTAQMIRTLQYFNKL